MEARVLKAEDVQFKSILELLSIRAAKMLFSKGADAYPCFQAYERSKEAKSAATAIALAMSFGCARNAQVLTLVMPHSNNA